MDFRFFLYIFNDKKKCCDSVIILFTVVHSIINRDGSTEYVFFFYFVFHKHPCEMCSTCKSGLVGHTSVVCERPHTYKMMVQTAEYKVRVETRNTDGVETPTRWKVGCSSYNNTKKEYSDTL